MTLDSLSRRDDPRTPRRRVPAWLLPLAIAAGFLLIFLALFRDRLLPARSVEVSVALATPASAPAAAPAPANPAAAPTGGGRMLFQASGWIEPDPIAYKASALIDGVVDTVRVLEGQTVEKGEVLATLVDADARLALKAAERERQRLVSSLAAHHAGIVTARRKLASAQSSVEAAQALEDEAADQFRRLDQLKDGAVRQGDVVSARLRLVREKAQKATAEADAAEVEADIARLELESVMKQDEVEAAGVALEQAQLALQRTQIPAPVSGRILKLLAVPGQKRMLAMDDDDSSSIAVLYDPAKLQVRVDVPLADAAGLKVGQPVRIHCGLLQEREFHGEVTRIAGEADLQRNTLQAKVRILDPVDELRPEMLCRAEFLAAPASGGATTTEPRSEGSLATWVPEKAVADGQVWVCDPGSKRVEPRPASSGAETREGFRRVDESVRPGEWVVLSPKNLKQGQRVNPQLVEP